MDVRSVDILVKIGTGSTVAILGQRGAKFSSTRDKIEVSVKASYPHKQYLPGWNDGNVDVDGLLQVGDGGFVELYNQHMSEELVDVLLTFGDTGEQLVGKALMSSLECDAPREKEPTYTCKLEKSGEWVPTKGS